MVHKRGRRRKRRARRRVRRKAFVRKVVTKVKKVVKKAITKRAIVRAKVKKVVRKVVAPRRPPRRVAPPTRPPIARPPTRPPRRPLRIIPKVPAVVRKIALKIKEKRAIRKALPPKARPPRRPLRIIPKVPIVARKIVGRIRRRKPFIIEREIIKPTRVTTRVPIIPPKKFGIDYQKATGAKTFTIAIPIGREAGKLKVQDFNFIFKDGKLVKTTPKSSILLTDAQYVERDERRRENLPEFTLGKVKLFPVKKPPVKKKLLIPPTRLIPAKIKERFVSKFKIIKKKIVKGFNIISGGTLTDKRLNKKQQALNEETRSFNKKFGDRELSQSAFKKAQAEKNILDKKASGLKKERETFEDSLTRRIGNIVWRQGALFPKGKQPPEVKVLAGFPPPILPVAGLPRNVKFKFVGTQKVKGNKVLTDIVFKSNGKRIGFAKGVLVTKGKEGFSITLGKSGVKSFKLPKGTIKILQKRSFIGVEKVKIKPATFTTTKQIELFKRIKGGKNVITIKKNIEGFRQVGVGKVSQVKGDTFFRAGKLKKGVTTDEFSSLSAIFTKGDLSKIIGRTITAKGDKVRFIGLIKGITETGKGFTLTGVQKSQYTQALQKVISVAAAAVAEGKKATGLSKVAQLTVSAGAIKNIIKARTRQIVKPKEITMVKVAPAIRVTPQQLQELIAKQKETTKQISKTKQKLKQVTTQTQTTTTQQTLTELQTQVQIIKQVQKGKISFRKGQSLIKGLKIISPILVVPIPKRKRKRIRKKKPKKRLGYKSLVKSKGKFKKVNIKPLSKTKAKDRGAYVTDRTVSATFKVKSVGKKKKLGKLPKKQRGYFKRKRKKFRGFKIVKGKRVKLKNKFIEKRKARIDTRGEKRGLTVAKLLRRERKKRKPFKKKVRSSFRKRTFKRRPIKRRVMKRSSFRKRIIRKPIKRKVVKKMSNRKRVVKKFTKRKKIKKFKKRKK